MMLGAFNTHLGLLLLAAFAARVTAAAASSTSSSIKVQWVYNSSTQVMRFGGVQGPNSIVYDPSNETVFFQGIDSNRNGMLTALSATTGAVVWAEQVGTADGSNVLRSGLTFGAGILWELTSRIRSTPTLSGFLGASGKLVVAHNKSFITNSNGEPQPLYWNGYVFCGTQYMHIFSATDPTAQSRMVGSGGQIAGERIVAYSRAGRNYVLYPWGGQVALYDITDMANITNVWTNEAQIQQSFATQNAAVAPDASAVFTQSTSFTSSIAAGLYVTKISTADGATVSSFGQSGYVNIPFYSSVSVALADVVVLAGSPVMALDAVTGQERWTYSWATYPGNPSACVAVEGWPSAVLCAVSAAPPAPSLVLLDASTGKVLASARPPTDAFGDVAVFGAGFGYQPVVIKSDPMEGSVEVIASVLSSVSALWPSFLARLTLRMAAPPPPPPSPSASGIQVQTWNTALGCPASVAPATISYRAGCSVNTASTSVLRFCAGGALQTQWFANSSICSGVPTSTESYPVGQCIDIDPTGSSLTVVRCDN